MTSKKSSDEILAARVLPVLRSLGRRADCVELNRLVRTDDSAAIYRILCKAGQVKRFASKDLTEFEWIQ